MTTVVRVGTSPDEIYIGRPSKWGNPFVIGRDGDRAEVIDRYRAYLRHRPELVAALGELRGRQLACHCSPQPCHGDVLAELADGYADLVG